MAEMRVNIPSAYCIALVEEMRPTGPDSALNGRNKTQQSFSVKALTAHVDGYGICAFHQTHMEGTPHPRK